jgi:hypothetical protein
MNPLLTQMLGESASVEIQARCWDADKTYTVKILGGSFPIDEGTTQTQSL